MPKLRAAPRAISRLGLSCPFSLSRECHIAVSLQRVALSSLSAFSSSALRLVSHCHRPFSPLLSLVLSRWYLRISAMSIKLCLAMVEHCHFFIFHPLTQPQAIEHD